MVHIEIPQDVSFILHKLRAAGFEGYAVGGCVRDSLLGKVPKDWDITTSALPQEVKELFQRTVDTGIKHGTVTVLVNGTGYEVTTYRVDGEYLDGRHPEEVSFTASLDEDLKRRDFTINAFVYNESEGIKDLFEGLKDLENGIIRCVGIPEERFSEDALRILRAVRFAAALSFTIEPATYEAACRLKENLRKVSAERIRTELEKTLISDNPDYICLLKDMGIDGVILEELKAVKDAESLKLALKSCQSVASIRWAVLGFFIEKADEREETGAITRNMMRRLKFDNRTIDTVGLFLRTREKMEKEFFGGTKEYPVVGRRLLNVIGEEDIYSYIDFAYTVCESKSYKDEYPVIKSEIEKILERGDCFSLKKLAVNGRDLKDGHIAEGKELGMLLDQLLEMVIVDPEKNTRDYLLEVAKAYGH